MMIDKQEMLEDIGSKIDGLYQLAIVRYVESLRVDDEELIDNWLEDNERSELKRLLSQYLKLTQRGSVDGFSAD